MRSNAEMHLPRRQRGLALLILLAIVALAGTYMLVSSLSKSGTAMTVAKSTRNRASMQEAKTALIAWAAAEAAQPTTGQGFQPGALPCPDVNNDGISDYSGQNCTGLLGRLPYKTLGVADLRDASGELLWYAVSSNFIRSTNNVINSDKQGVLNITGLAPASSVIAVVLAPGMPVQVSSVMQNRGAAGVNTASNYLENTNGVANSTNFVTATENLTDPVNSFNDQLLAIAHQDLFAIVEPVVAARIQRDIVRQFIYDPSATGTSNNWTDGGGPDRSRYFDAWGGFPFAASFVDQTSGSPSVCPSIYRSAVGTYEGLLPVVSCLNYTWSSGSVVQTGGSGTVWWGSSCAPANSNQDLQCDIWYQSGAPRIRISGSVNNVGRSFVQLPQISDVDCSRCTGNSRSVSGSLNSAGAGIVTFNATLSSAGGWTNFTLTINSLNTSPLLSTTGSDVAGWFNNNQWYKQSYYAVSPGYAPGGAGNCNPSTNPQCLSVANLPAPYANPVTNAQAIVVFAGRSLSGATRPNATLSDYLEGNNASTGDYSFEHAKSRSAIINDKVIVVAP